MDRLIADIDAARSSPEALRLLASHYMSWVRYAREMEPPPPAFRTLLEEGVRRHPGDAELRYQLAIHLATFAPKDLDGAWRHMEAALALRPQEPRFHVERATIHEDRGDSDRARSELADGLLRLPDSLAIRVKLAELQIDADDQTAAQETLEGTWNTTETNRALLFKLRRLLGKVGHAEEARQLERNGRWRRPRPPRGLYDSLPPTEALERARTAARQGGAQSEVFLELGRLLDRLGHGQELLDVARHPRLVATAPLEAARLESQALEHLGRFIDARNALDRAIDLGDRSHLTDMRMASLRRLARLEKTVRGGGMPEPLPERNSDRIHLAQVLAAQGRVFEAARLLPISRHRYFGRQRFDCAVILAEAGFAPTPPQDVTAEEQEAWRKRAWNHLASDLFGRGGREHRARVTHDTRLAPAREGWSHLTDPEVRAHWERLFQRAASGYGRGQRDPGQTDQGQRGQGQRPPPPPDDPR